MIETGRWRNRIANVLSRRAGDGARGAIWSGLSAGASVALPFIAFIFFAHVLSPAQIGLVALAVSCAEFVRTIGLPGLYEALLQHPEDRQRYHETALAVLLAGAVTLLAVYAGLLLLLQHLIPGIAAERPALLAIGLRIPFGLVVLQPQAALAQRLSYRHMALRTIVANAGAVAIGVAIALDGAPLAGLVTYQVGQTAFTLLAITFGTRTLVRPRLHRPCLRRMAHEATMSSTVRLVAATNNYVDQIIIAAVLSSTHLAWFNLAKRVEATFITTASSFSSILFQPLFAARRGEQRAQVLQNGLGMLTLLCGLPTAFLAFNSLQVVTLVFGARWAPSAPVVALLAAAGLARALGSVHGALLSVSARNRQLAIISTSSAVSGILAVLVAAPFGIAWCAAGLAARNVVITFWLASATRHDAPHTARAYLTEVLVPLGLMLLGTAGGCLLATKLAPLTPIVTPAVSLLCGGLLGLAWFAPRLLRGGLRPLPITG